MAESIADANSAGESKTLFVVFQWLFLIKSQSPALRKEMAELERKKCNSVCFCPSFFVLEVKVLAKMVWCNLLVRTSSVQLLNSRVNS